MTRPSTPHAPDTRHAIAAPHRGRHTHLWWIACAVALAAVAGAVAVFVTGLRSHTPPRPVSRPAIASPTAPLPGETAMTGTDLLNALAQRSLTAIDDPRAGGYEHTRTISWTLGPDDTVTAVDRHTWHHPDDGRECTLIQRKTLPAKGFDPQSTSVDFTDATIRTDTAADHTSTVDVTLPDGGDPVAALQDQLAAAAYPDRTVDDSRIQDLAAIYQRQVVPGRLRAAILRTLAQLPQVTYRHQRTTDPAGREGIAVQTTFALGLATTLIFDPATGHLNAVRRQYGNRLLSYTLIYPAAWTDTCGTATPRGQTTATTAPPPPER